jgi:hypothetical protein
MTCAVSRLKEQRPLQLCECSGPNAKTCPCAHSLCGPHPQQRRCTCWEVAPLVHRSESLGQRMPKATILEGPPSTKLRANTAQCSTFLLPPSTCSNPGGHNPANLALGPDRRAIYIVKPTITSNVSEYSTAIKLQPLLVDDIPGPLIVGSCLQQQLLMAPVLQPPRL